MFSKCICVYTCICYITDIIFFFKQKTAYEMRISDWSSDVCSSDLVPSELARGPDRADGSVADLTTKQLEALWTPALYGYIWGCRFGINQMIKQGRGGSVVNISSTTSFQSMANLSGYIASKGAMNSTTRSMAVEYGQFGIRSEEK